MSLFSNSCSQLLSHLQALYVMLVFFFFLTKILSLQLLKKCLVSFFSYRISNSLLSNFVKRFVTPGVKVAKMSETRSKMLVLIKDILT